jgi:3-hydroxyacyl-[acyl-carrier-protein] dehydratase
MKPDQMFLNDLFTIIQTEPEENSNKLLVSIRLNPSHQIFKGHFPGNPILPGVCIVQIMKDILMYHLGKELILQNAGSIKYLSFINPEVNNIVNFDFGLKEPENDRILCNVSLFFGSVVFCRFKGEFKIIKK